MQSEVVEGDDPRLRSRRLVRHGYHGRGIGRSGGIPRIAGTTLARVHQPPFDASFAVIEPLRSAMDLTLERMDADGIDASWSVGPETHQPYGIVHGGVHCMVVEGLCSMAAALWLAENGPSDGRVVGVSNSTDFYRAVSEGRLSSVCRPIHRGRSQQVWTVETTAADGKLVARGQVRLQNLR